MEKLVNVFFGVFIGLCIPGVFIKGKIILDKREHVRQCRTHIGVGNFICGTDMTLEETEKDRCK